MLRRIIVTQGDTEPASVEQQRLLGHTAPSLYDLRNLFQVNVEEGRHLWAMVYLLHTLLRPRRPRRGRGACSSAARATPTSRASSARSTSRSRTGSTSSCSRCSPTATASTSSPRSPESGFDPLARTTASCSPRKRTTCSSARPASSASWQRTAELMKQGDGDVRKLGGIDLADPAEVPEPLVLALARSVRRRDLVERGRLLRRRPQGPRQGGQVRGPPGARRQLPHDRGRGRQARATRTCRCATR